MPPPTSLSGLCPGCLQTGSVLSSISEAFKRNVLSVGCVSLCLGKHEKVSFQVFPSVAVVVVGFIIFGWFYHFPWAGRRSSFCSPWLGLPQGLAWQSWGSWFCFQTGPRCFWELLGCLSGGSGACSVGAPGAQREGGVGGSGLLRNVGCSGLFSGDAGRAVWCYRLSKTGWHVSP